MYGGDLLFSVDLAISKGGETVAECVGGYDATNFLTDGHQLAFTIEKSAVTMLPAFFDKLIESKLMER